MFRRVESKVLVPAIVGLVTALLALLAAFGLDLSSQQQAAILGVTAPVLVLLQFLSGYSAPHTPRPDLGAPVVTLPYGVVPEQPGGDDLGNTNLTLALVVFVAVLLALAFFYLVTGVSR